MTKTDKCALSESECKELENIRISLWDSTFKIEENAKNIYKDINKLTNLIKNTLQDPYYTGELMNTKRMAKFLSNGEIYELKDNRGKYYRQPGYYNNIINQIEADCGCPSRNERAKEDKLKIFIPRL